MSKKKKASKKIKSVQKEYDWYKKKVEEMEAEREYDRTWESKQLLVKMKKYKLLLKTQISRMLKTIGI